MLFLIKIVEEVNKIALFKKNSEEIKNFPEENFEILNNIFNHLKQDLKGKREIIHPDIINSTIRKGNFEEKFNQLIL